MNPITVYNTVDYAHPYRLVGPGNSQTQIGPVWLPPREPQWSGGQGPASFTALGHYSLRINSWSIHNRAGGTQLAVGFGGRVPNDYWIAGTWTDATTTFTVNSAVKAAGTSWPYEGGTTLHNNGLVVLSRAMFNAWSFDVMVSSSAAPVRALSYWGTLTGATSAWITITNPFILDGAAGTLVITGTTIANEAIACWAPPSNMVLTESDGIAGTNIPAGYYAVRMRATTAPSVAAVGQRLQIYRMFHLTEALADNGLYEGSYGPAELRYDQANAAVALFDTANPQNRITINVRASE